MSYFQSEVSGEVYILPGVTTPPNGSRLVVVIAPEDAEQVERLVYALAKGSPNISRRFYDDVTAALREFATPTPVKPEEPRALGAVVQDASGRKFTRHCDCNPGASDWWVNRAIQAKGGRSLKWSEIDAVRVLSEGVPS